MELQYKQFDFKQPKYQAMLALVPIISTLLLTKAVFALGITKTQPQFFWVATGAFLLLYIVASAAILLSIKSQDVMMYAFRSFQFFLGLLILGGLIAYAFSGINVFESEFSPIFILLIITDTVLLAMGMFIRRIMDWLEEEHQKVG